MDTRKDQDLATGAMLPPSLEPDMLSMDEAAGIPMPEGRKSGKPVSPLQDSLRRLRRDKRAMISLGIIVFFFAIALVGPPIYQHIGGPYNSAISVLTFGPSD